MYILFFLSAFLNFVRYLRINIFLMIYIVKKKTQVFVWNQILLFLYFLAYSTCISRRSACTKQMSTNEFSWTRKGNNVLYKLEYNFLSGCVYSVYNVIYIEYVTHAMLSYNIRQIYLCIYHWCVSQSCFFTYIYIL